MHETTLKKAVKRAGIKRISHGKDGSGGALRALRDAMDAYSRRVAFASEACADGHIIQPKHVQLAAKSIGINIYGVENKIRKINKVTTS